MTPERQEPKTVLCFGDSNTWGFNPDGSGRLPYATRWPTQLEHRLNEASTGSLWRTVEDGLNSRTWLLDDPIGAVSYGADYSCSGRSHLKTALHTHKPIDVVVLALGCNDCKHYLNLAVEQIAAGASILIHDIRQAVHCGPHECPERTPHIVLMTPPLVRSTPQSLTWGFSGADTKSKAVAARYQSLAEELQVTSFDVQRVATPSALDGVHFDSDAQSAIADALATCILQTLHQTHQ